MADNPNQNPNQNQPAAGATPEGAPSPPEGNEVKILDTREFPSTNPERAGKLDTLITYQLDPQHVYTIIEPKSDLSKEEVSELVRADFKKKQGIVGTTVSV